MSKKELDIIIQIAQKTGEIILKYYCKNMVLKTKFDDPENFLTIADEEADDFIRKRLSQEFPNDLIISEENDFVPKNYSGRVWMVDPQDGTGYFVHGQDGFSVMIGLCVNGVPTLGVVYAPARKDLFYAEKGKGAFFQNLINSSVSAHKIKVSSISQLNQARFVIRKSMGKERDADRIVQKILVKEKIKEGSSGLKISKIAKGEAEFHLSTIQRTAKWDTCAAQVILEEAGGKLTFVDGTSLDYKQNSVTWHKLYLASNGYIHQKVMERITKINQLESQEK